MLRHFFEKSIVNTYQLLIQFVLFLIIRYVCVHQLVLNICVINIVCFTGFFACQYLGSSLDLFILKIVW